MWRNPEKLPENWRKRKDPPFEKSTEFNAETALGIDSRISKPYTHGPKRGKLSRNLCRRSKQTEIRQKLLPIKQQLWWKTTGGSGNQTEEIVRQELRDRLKTRLLDDTCAKKLYFLNWRTRCNVRWGKASGPDYIHNAFVGHLGLQAQSWLYHSFSKLFASGCMPKACFHVLVKPHHDIHASVAKRHLTRFPS